MRRGRPGPAAPPARHRLARRARPTRWTTGCAGPGRRPTPAGPCRSGVVANAADAFPALLARGAPVDVVTDQTSAHDPLHGYVPAGPVAGRRGRRCGRATPAEYVRRARAVDGRPLRGDGRLRRRRGRGLRLRQQPPGRGASTAGSTGRLLLSRASSPPTSGRCSARARARSAGSPSPATRPTSPPPTRAVLRGLPRRRRRCSAGCALARGAGAVPGSAGPDLLARLRRARRRRPALQRPGPPGRGEAPDRDRPRPPRRRLGRLALPRDGGHGRRLRRHRRLADPQRPAQRGRGAAWVAVHHGGGVGMGRSIHAGWPGRGRRHRRRRPCASTWCCATIPARASSATPTPATPRRQAVARERGVRMPMLPADAVGSCSESASLLVQEGAVLGRDLRGDGAADLGLIERGAVLIRGGRCGGWARKRSCRTGAHAGRRGRARRRGRLRAARLRRRPHPSGLRRRPGRRARRPAWPATGTRPAGS